MFDTDSLLRWWHEAGIRFVWPELLWLLGLIILGIVLYQVARRGRSSQVSGILSASIIIVGLTALIMAIARPQVTLSLPTRADRLMVVLDISGSMRADDAEPSRFDVAKATIAQLLDQQPANLQLGLVTTAASATLIQAPTTDRNALRDALNNASLQTGSALGSGLLIGLAELLPGADIDVQALMNASLQDEQGTATANWQLAPEKIVPPGSNRSTAMVLISDGESNMGPKAMAMAELAAKLGVRVHTIGVGTARGAVVKAEGISQRVRLDSALLADISGLTIGNSYQATQEQDWLAIYEAIDASIQFDRRQPMEVSAIFMGVGLLLILFGMGTRLVRQGRIL